jgi:ubiquinone/menaquinone biosynthesis C-methylase UbiE
VKVVTVFCGVCNINTDPFKSVGFFYYWEYTMNIDSKTYPGILDEVYSTNYENVSHKIHLYGELYDLPRISFNFHTNSHGYFDYTTTISSFVVLVLYTSTKKIFLRVSADSSSEEYYLLATHILPETSIEETVYALSKSALPDVKIAGVEPVAILEHTFEFSDGVKTEKHSMPGIAYIARILDAVEFESRHVIPDGSFFPVSEARNLLSQNKLRKYSNHSVLETALNRLDSFFELRIRPPDREISHNQLAAARYEFHEKFVKPIFKIMKNHHRFEKALLNIVGKPKRFLDVSCGESNLIFKVSKKGVDLCVGNDVSWDQITLLLNRFKPKDRTHILFTNHNLVFLPYKKQYFDVAVCKNTLHHLGSPSEFRLAIENLVSIAKKVVIVEIEDPSIRIFPRLINKYYNDFLLDAGECFFDERQFKEALEQTLSSSGEYSISITKHRSLIADYMIAEICTK